MGLAGIAQQIWRVNTRVFHYQKTKKSAEYPKK
jgi:hypothetical protein